MKTGKQTPLTFGEYVVLDVLHWDAKTNYIYYIANGKDAPQVKHIWSVQADEHISNERKKHCLTCGIQRGGVNQTYFGASFSPNGSHVVITNDGPSLPRTDIVRMTAPSSSKYNIKQIL